MELGIPQPARITKLFGNDVLGRVERLRINSSHRFTNRMRGEHLRGKGGQSTEFADYRDYVEGDDIRFIDWNIFSRLQRPYLKLFHMEEEMHVVLLLDASSSMLFEDKLQRAKQMAAAFGVMGLFNVEKVSIFAFNRTDTKAPERLPPCSGRGSMRQLFAFLEEIEGGGDAPLEEGIEKMLRHHRGRGVAVILSDFLTYGDLRKALNLVYSSGLETFGLQILGPTEIDPDVTGDLRFVDSETENMLDVTSVGNLLNLYQEYRLAYQRNLEVLCQQRAGRFISISAADQLNEVLFDLLRRKGWVV